MPGSHRLFLVEAHAVLPRQLNLPASSRVEARGHTSIMRRQCADLTYDRCTRRGATPKRANSSQTFFDTAFTACGDADGALPVVCASAAAPIYRSPSAFFAVPRLAVMLPPVQLAPPGIQQALPAELMAPWQCFASAASASAPQSSLRAELLAVRAEAATASAQLHGCQAQLVQVRPCGRSAGLSYAFCTRFLSLTVLS